MPQDQELLKSITHVALAFITPSGFNAATEPTEWPLFMQVSSARQLFAPGTKMMVATGGWGDTEGFSQAARTAEGRKLFARNIAAMLQATGADGEFSSIQACRRSRLWLTDMCSGVDVD